MKKTTLLILIFLLMSVYAFKTLDNAVSDFLQRLGIPESLAQDCVWESFSGVYLSYPNVAKLKAVPNAERGNIVLQVGEFAKKFTLSDEFKKRYLEYREGRKPAPPTPPKSMAESRKEQKEELQKAIQETEQNMKNLPADQQEMMKGVVATLKEQLKSIDDPNNPMFSPEVENMMKQSYASEMEDHKKNLEKWEKEYPLSPNKMITHWLEEFLEVSKDVDFNAKLVEGDAGKKVFANPQYEKQSPQWKMCYRAGKETVTSGRTFAETWIKELKSAK